MLSKTEEYALRAVVYLATEGDRAPVRAAEMATATGIPANYLSKILHQLGRHGIVISERGRHGGFRLARIAGDLSLADVIAPFGSLDRRGRCLLGRPECSDTNPCGAHDSWKGVKERISDFFAEVTVGDVIDRGDPG